MPRFSVIVPTRDRPDLLEFCLESIARQTFDDFEVIVSDNPMQTPARAIFDRWAGSGWRYLRPDGALPMHENFERGCAEAKGDYVAVVIDKTVLHPSALEVAHGALEAEPADIVTWWNDGYNPVNEARSVGKGRFRPAAVTASPALYDPAAALAQRFSNLIRRGTDPVEYARGKIVFGAYSKALVDRISAHTGRLFYPLAPDYTSMVPACVLCDRALDVGRPLLVSYNSSRSNGRRQSRDPAHARRFIEAADSRIISALPIPGLYASQHNVVGYDLVSSAARCPLGTTPPLDFVNLLRRAREDLGEVVWPDPAERVAQYSILEAAEAAHGITPVPSSPSPPRTTRRAVARVLTYLPPVESLVYRAAGLPNPSAPVFASPLDAARAADRYYAAAHAER